MNKKRDIIKQSKYRINEFFKEDILENYLK